MDELQPVTPPLARIAWPALALNALLALPTATVIAAVAGLVVAIAAFPVALSQTHDLYLALLALSYGPFAAAMTLQSVIVATMLWALLHPIRRMAASAAALTTTFVLGGGMVAGLGMLGGTVPVLGVVSTPWRYGPALALTLQNISVAAFAGMLAGGVALLHASRATRPVASPSMWWANVWPRTRELAWFTLPLALVLEAWAAILAAQGRM